MAREILTQEQIDRLLDDRLHDIGELDTEGLKSSISLECIHCGLKAHYTADPGTELITAYAARPNAFRKGCKSNTGHFFKIPTAS